MTEVAWTPKKSASDLLIEAYSTGRPIIPFLGAGISVGSGFPSMTAITAYLAKVRFFVRRVFKGGQLSETDYLRVHGWPDFSQLNADLWRYLVGEPEKSAAAVLDPFLNKLSREPRPTIQEFKDLSKWDVNRNGRMRLVVQSQFWDALSDNDYDAAQPLWPSILIPNKTDLRGDWYDLMMSLTEGDFDLVDGLFLVLGQNRRPAGDHVFLAQLADAFRVRLYLSLNFDPLLETALWDEGHVPNVIEVAKDAALPSPESVRDRLTVLKLHGGAYGLRIGERIQESLDPNTQTRAKNIIPEDALILVLGFSGYERRMTQILIEHCRRRPNETQLLWMNFGNRNDKPLEKMREKFKTGNYDYPIAVRQYHGVSSLLQNVLIRARGAHPAGKQGYFALPTRPWAELPKTIEDDKPIVAFFRDSDWQSGREPPSHSDASVTMAQFCNSKAKSHHTIWIDCEQHHTVDGVVAEILDRIYQYDPNLQPLLMQSAGGSDATYERPIERIREALQRGNYVLAIDSPETIGRPQTVHHGTPSFFLRSEKGQTDKYEERVQNFKNRVLGFFTFLTNLLTQVPTKERLRSIDIGASYICVAIAPPSGKNAPDIRGKFKDLEPEYVCSVISKKFEDRMPAEFVNRFINLLDLSNERLRLSKIFHELTCPGDPNDEAAINQWKNLDEADTISIRLKEWLDAVEREGVKESTEMPSDFVHVPEQHQKLPAHRRIGLEREIVKRQRQIVGGPMDRQVQEVSLHFEKSPSLDLHMRMPTLISLPVARPAPAPIADRIARISQRNPSNVSEGGGLFFEETVLPFRREYREGPLMTKVLQVCQPRLFSPGPRLLRNSDAIFFDELEVDHFGVLARGNAAGYIPPVAVSQIRAGNLLDKARDGNNFGTILHVPPMHQREGLFQRHNPSKSHDP